MGTGGGHCCTENGDLFCSPIPLSASLLSLADPATIGAVVVTGGKSSGNGFVQQTPNAGSPIPL